VENPVDNRLSLLASNRAPTAPLTAPPEGHRTTVPPCPFPYGARGAVERPRHRAVLVGHGRILGAQSRNEVQRLEARLGSS